MTMSVVVALRMFHLATLALIFGGIAWSRYCRETVWRGLPPLCALALLSGLAWLWWVATNLTDAAFPAEWRNVQAVLSGTSFGRMWSLHLASIVATSIACVIDRRTSASLATVGLATLPWITLSLTGHSIVHEGPPGMVHRVFDAVHGLAAATWVGGLLSLALFIRRALREPLGGNPDYLMGLVQRFSRAGLVSVALIALSGLGNAFMLNVSLTGIPTQTYSWIVISKIALFALMLMLAAYNRFVLTPRLVSPDRNYVALMLVCSVLLELILGTLVIGLAALLGILVPPLAEQ